MNSLRDRIQTWYESIRQETHLPLIKALCLDIEERFPELLGIDVPITEPSQELHPMQQVILDPEGTARFRENPIIRDLLNQGQKHGFDLNHIVGRGGYRLPDLLQFYQLIGYSVDGYGDLSGIPEESVGAAYRAAKLLETKP